VTEIRRETARERDCVVALRKPGRRSLVRRPRTAIATDDELKGEISRVYVYPAFNARYYAHYEDALRSLVGSARVRYTVDGFPHFTSDCLAFRVVAEGERRFYIHSDDPPEIDAEGVEWCDVFGKVNFDPDLVPEDATHKVTPIGPTFPWRTMGALRTAQRALLTYLRSGGAAGSFRRHLAQYRGLYASRFQEPDYTPGSARSDYIFFNGSLWEREPEANRLRANFVDAARSAPGVQFEGGLSPRDSARGTQGWVAPGYEEYFVPRFARDVFLEKTRRSAVAFNNPAYRDCHSWRLAEYLALGKAIITTPLRRGIPAPLEHGEHVHLVDGSVDSIRSAIGRICGDDEYRVRLESNARSYFEDHLHPRCVVSRLLAAGGVELPQSAALDARSATTAV
jgi:hypothetical protein